MVRLDAGRQRLRAVVTTESVNQLGLATGSAVFVEFNSHEVLLMREPLPAMSAGNVFRCVIANIRPGDVMAMVELDSDGFRIRSWITREAAETLGLQAGQTVVAVVKSTEVSLELAS